MVNRSVVRSRMVKGSMMGSRVGGMVGSRVRSRMGSIISWFWGRMDKRI